MSSSTTATPLVRAFERAGLPIKVASAPLVGNGGGEIAKIVQLDIERRRRNECFRLWQGDAGNRVVVEGVDRDLQQLVLLVDEPRRRFEVELSPWAHVPEGARVVFESRRGRRIEQWTDARKRHFLCGMDESHLFIAALPRGVSTVRAAHEALRSPVLSVVERWAPARTIRQGEWFFVALSPMEEQHVNQLERELTVHEDMGIAQAARLRRAGRPHVADEVLVRRDWREGSMVPAVIYVRGRVRHPDHKTVRLRTWRRAVPNAEPITTPDGVLWVD